MSSARFSGRKIAAVEEISGRSPRGLAEDIKKQLGLKGEKE